jgi:hypothetical protein
MSTSAHFNLTGKFALFTGQTLLVDGGNTVNDTRALPARKK